MKTSKKVLSAILAGLCCCMCLSVFGCEEKAVKYDLSVNYGEGLLYEDLKDSYKAGETVNVKVKITPNKNTVAYLDLVQLKKTKGEKDDFLTFSFTMPEKKAVLSIKNLDGFEEDYLTGFYLTFYKDEGAIESLNKNLESPDAAAKYLYTYTDEESGQKIFTLNEGANVFCDTKTSSHNGFEKIELESTLYYTHELLDCVAFVDWVYFDEKNGTFRANGNAGQGLSGIGIGSYRCNQTMTYTTYDENYKERTYSFESNITINFSYIDYLTGVKIHEYDKDNQLIKTSVFDKNIDGEYFSVDSACEYAVVEEEYTAAIKDGESEAKKHYERTLINKDDGNTGIALKYPRGDGLISPFYLSIIWQEEQA